MLFSTHFNTTGNILYGIKPSASPLFPASAAAPTDESLGNRRMHHELFFCPWCILQNSCRHDAGNAAADRIVIVISAGVGCEGRFPASSDLDSGIMRNSVWSQLESWEIERKGEKKNGRTGRDVSRGTRVCELEKESHKDNMQNH